ncbi:50S ribosomal protein L24 [Candidatus Woesearchaeota archaeon]|nr:50S ribosomal protein L24 [Candidatus Woesearchaeota archaeon]MCF7901348.1 50S ribosomal protein L24 [Candidatus Woesearchaeota archaeon]MCF8013348.1 50S ribosomal protein L24 [Candidatus Woesearchaeota archaeon]
MKTKFSKTWNKSVQPRKQRKYNYNAPLHVKQKSLSVNLSKELRQKYGLRNIPVRTGDKVLIQRGSFKGKDGKVEELNLKTSKIYITKIERTKKDGSKTRVPMLPSNLQIVELNLEDKKRKAKINQKTASKSQKAEKTQTAQKTDKGAQ